MPNRSSDSEAVRHIIDQINALWQSKQYKEIRRYLAEDVVILPPGFTDRVEGRDAYVQSYRDFDQNATVHEFSPDEPQIEIFENTAIAICPFSIKYELTDTLYRERGSDILVFSRISSAWRIIWRTMVTE